MGRKRITLRKTTSRTLQKNFHFNIENGIILALLFTTLIIWTGTIILFLKDDANDSHEKNLSHAKNKESLRKFNEFLDFQRNQYLGPKYQNPSILKSHCSVTILLMDPATGTPGNSNELFYSLESTVSNIHPSAKETACILLQTSHCLNKDGIQGVYNRIWTHAQTELKQMIVSGNVRVTFLDHKKYKVRSCSNFYNPSSAWMNAHYWVDEFESEDSDLVLSIQNDSVLCHTFNPDLWRDVAWVGGVWPPHANMHNNPMPPEGMCNFLPLKWKEWSHVDNVNLPKNLCVPNSGEGAFGNGGLTIRSRQWLIKAIRFCPFSKYAGLTSLEVKNAKCSLPARADPAEDVFFSIILRVMGAPLPSEFEASLFSVEMIFAEHVLEYYYDEVTDELEKELEAMVVRRWGNDTIDNGLELFRRMRKQKYTIPIGFHKPYWYYSYDELSAPYIKNECQFLDDIIPPSRKKR